MTSDRGTPVSLNDAERVHRHVRRRIIEGDYPPGSRLTEKQISAEVDVSRTPVREALRRLESEGLVVTERNRGARVRPLDLQAILDLYDVRARLEGYGAELAAARAADDDVAALRAAAHEFSSAAGRRSGPGSTEATRRLEDANRSFHQRLLTASRHDRLPALVAGAVDAPLVFQALHRFDADELKRSALFHHLITDAIDRRDGARAGRLMTEHILQGRDALADRMTYRPLTEDAWLQAVHDRETA